MSEKKRSPLMRIHGVVLLAGVLSCAAPAAAFEILTFDRGGYFFDTGDEIGVFALANAHATVIIRGVPALTLSPFGGVQGVTAQAQGPGAVLLDGLWHTDDAIRVRVDAPIGRQGSGGLTHHVIGGEFTLTGSVLRDGVIYGLAGHGTWNGLLDRVDPALPWGLTEVGMELEAPPSTATPEPATLLLVGTTVAGLGLARWWKRARRTELLG